MSRMLPEPLTPDPRQPVPEGGEIETRLNIPLTAEELDWVEHAASLRDLHVVEYVRRAINLSLTKEGVDAVLLSESEDEDEYSKVEQDCRGCMGPCGRCHEQAQRQDSSSVQEGAVEAAFGHLRSVTLRGGDTPADVENYHRARDRVVEAVRQSSPRSQPVTAKEAHQFVAFGIDDPRYYADICAKCGDIHEPQPVTSASIEEAISAFATRWRGWQDGHNFDADLRVLITAVRQESTS